MHHTSKHVRQSGGSIVFGTALVAGLLAIAIASSFAQVSPEEHAKHHPDEGQQPSTAPTGTGLPAGSGPPDGMTGMGEMMKNMGKPPPMELYPSLMALLELTPEQRKQVEAQANERMHAGTALIAQSLDALNAGTQSDDYAAMHEAMTRLQEGAAQLESGIAARRTLAEGRAPRGVALDWFKREMNLASPMPSDEPRTLLGATPFHLFAMVLLVAFALAMLAMYFFKMRRAAALFGRIEADKRSPPPGSAPELAGGKPPGGDKPPSGDKPVAAADKPAAA